MLPGIFHQCHLQQTQEFGRIGGSRPPGRLPPLPPLRLRRLGHGRRCALHLPRGEVAPGHGGTTQGVHLLQPTAAFPDTALESTYINLYINLNRTDLWTLVISRFLFRFGIFRNLLRIHCHHLRFLDILGPSNGRTLKTSHCTKGGEALLLVPLGIAETANNMVLYHIGALS